jgi:HlyD family secretion protein
MAERINRFVTIIKRRRTPLALALLIVIGGVVTTLLLSKRAETSDYITAKVERGSVEVTVSATGTVQAVTTVQVGSQVSGTVSWLGADFKSHVKRGQVIAKLDPAIFEAQVENNRANVANAQAAVQAAQTEINNQKANLAAAKANQEVARVQRDDAMALVKRYQELKAVISGRDIEAAQAQANAAAARYEQASAQIGQAQANVASAQAKVQQAQASVKQAQAQLEQATLNMSHSIIASPIDGVVVSRNVDVGQTVAASLQAPTLFTIANDLTDMQVLASVDEADVGQIREGTKANFSVDAYPGETFTGQISQIRLNAQALQNVVTYTAVIQVQNPDMKLLPGMTANITIPVARRDNVLTVPNSALRFRPNLSEKEQQELREKMQARREQREAGQQNDNQQAQPQGQPGEGGRRQRGQGGAGGQQAGGGAAESSDGGQQRQQRATVWVLVEGKRLEPRFIRTGITNGRVTEVVAGDLNEGDVIVTGSNDANSTNRTQQPGGNNPFGGSRPQGGGPRGR